MKERVHSSKHHDRHGHNPVSPISPNAAKKVSVDKETSEKAGSDVETMSVESFVGEMKPANVTAAFWWSTLIILCIAVFVSNINAFYARP